MNQLIEKARNIQCLICDVDGVLTNGLLYIGSHNHEFKAFNIQDGFGLKLLMAADITVAVITTSQHAMVTDRMRQLGIEHYFTGQVDKRDAFKTLCTRLQLPPHAFAYIGDDLPDLPILQQVGLSVAVANAVTAVKDAVHWTTTKSGGDGAVREVCDLLLHAQNKQDLALKRYLGV